VFKPCGPVRQWGRFLFAQQYRHRLPRVADDKWDDLVSGRLFFASQTAKGCRGMTTSTCRMFFRWFGKPARRKIMTRSARIGLAAALLVGGATMAMAQNGPATGGYPPARLNPNLYGHYGYHHRYYGHHHRYYAYYPRYHHHRHWYRY
jgi:hypothetical protein